MGVNISNVDHVLMEDWMIFVKICNFKMGVEYNYKKKTICYIDEVVQVRPPPPLVPQPTNQGQTSNQQLFDYMTYMNTSINDKFSYL